VDAAMFAGGICGNRGHRSGNEKDRHFLIFFISVWRVGSYDDGRDVCPKWED
jgi:hypothetical protein